MQNRYSSAVEEIISSQALLFKTVPHVEARSSIPSDFPLENNKWLQIDDVVCVYVDIENSTALNAVSHPRKTASVYGIFVETAVRIFSNGGASYIDVTGDGVFALFNKNEVHKAFVTAVTFKTFAQHSFLENVKNLPVKVGYHMGIDQKTVLVKQIGMRGGSDRKNEVWAGKPVNMASKLASCSTDNELWISDRFFNNLNDSELIKMTCGCEGEGNFTGNKVSLWNKKVDLSENPKFDFDLAYVLKSFWCVDHGTTWASKILKFDK